MLLLKLWSMEISCDKEVTFGSNSWWARVLLEQDSDYYIGYAFSNVMDNGKFFM